MGRHFAFFCSLSALLIGLDSACGEMAPPPPIPERVSKADVVLVGTVAKMEEKTVHALPFWGGEKKAEHMVAVVKIEEAITGAKGLTHMRVGFIPSAGGLRYRPTQQLKVGENVCLFLHKHPKQSFHLLGGYYDKIVLNPKAPQGFLKEVELAKKAAALKAEPLVGLKSKEAETRYLAAAMLISEYRTPPRFSGAKVVEKPIDGAVSKQILSVLAEADWKKPPLQMGYQFMPQYLFQRLGVGPGDGLTYPKKFQERMAAMQKWL